MKKAKRILAVLASMAVLTLAVACNSAQVYQQTASGQSGIWVNGVGMVSLDPDLALLRLGVETQGDTVSEAMNEAARAMTGIMDALEANGVQKKDIQTSYFNISPEYVYQEVYDGTGRYNKQVLTGYRVSNTLTAKVRDLDTIGTTIDEVATGGGDATRIQSIQFTVEDSSDAQTAAREAAILNAVAKADQFATLTGNSRGQLLYITESGSAVPTARSFDQAAFGGAEAAFDKVTPISTGELQIQVSVQAVFAIQAQ